MNNLILPLTALLLIPLAAVQAQAGDTPAAKPQATTTINPDAPKNKPIRGNLLPTLSVAGAVGNGVPGWKSRAWAGGSDAQWNVESPGRTGRRCLTIGSEKGADAAWTATVTVRPDTFLQAFGMDQDQRCPRRGRALC